MTAAAPETRPPRRPIAAWEAVVRGWRWFAVFGVGLLAAFAAMTLFTVAHPAPRPPTRAETRSDIATAVATALAGAAANPASAQVYRTILPSLVFIRTDEQAEDASIGSGVIVADDGSILTANHVVQGARSITVTFADGTQSPAQIASTFPNDLAVLRADRGPEIVVPAVLGGGPQVGDQTFAVGNPLGLVASLSAGVISGLNRTIPTPTGGPALTGLIQFDAAVNPGSSGGPLLNRDGQLIGIVTALANPANERAFTGIGFAVPLSSAGGGIGGPPR